MKIDGESKPAVGEEHRRSAYDGGARCLQHRGALVKRRRAEAL
jgi:hypothetical protein